MDKSEIYIKKWRPVGWINTYISLAYWNTFELGADAMLERLRGEAFKIDFRRVDSTTDEFKAHFMGKKGRLAFIPDDIE